MGHRRLKNRSKYEPHQGTRERDRRLRQIRAYWLQLPGCKLGPSSMGMEWGWVMAKDWGDVMHKAFERGGLDQATLRAEERGDE